MAVSTAGGSKALGLAAFGVALAIADVDAALVRTTARWCGIGAGARCVLVVLTLLGSTTGLTELGTLRSRPYLVNFLIGGSVGSTITGLYAARTHRHRRQTSNSPDATTCKDNNSGRRIIA